MGAKLSFPDTTFISTCTPSLYLQATTPATSRPLLPRFVLIHIKHYAQSLTHVLVIPHLTTAIFDSCYQPQNVKVLRDVMANGYRAGGNAKFFGPDGDLTKAKEAIMKRLAFEDGENEDYPASLLAFPMKREQYDNKCQTVMSLTSRLLPWEVQGGTHDSFPGGEEGFQVYESLLSLRQVHFGTRSSVFVAQCPTRFSLISVAEWILTFVCSDVLLCR